MKMHKHDLVSDDEVRAADTAVFEFLEANPRAKETIGNARHSDVVKMIHAVLQASAEVRAIRAFVSAST